MDALDFARDYWQFLKKEKKWWITPIVLAILLLTFLAIATEGSALMPFIYTMF